MLDRMDKWMVFVGQDAAPERLEVTARRTGKSHPSGTSGTAKHEICDRSYLNAIW
jgi:hypothetical protein